MKVSRKEVTEKPKFKPFDVVISVESKEEEKAFNFLFNLCATTDAKHISGIIDFPALWRVFNVKNCSSDWSEFYNSVLNYFKID